MSNNKNSFRDMILIIFVVLICFGITIYGIAYLTGKVFSGSSEVEVADNDMPKEVSTNPQEGDTITFTTMGEEGEEVMPDINNIVTTVTPPANNEVANTAPDNNIVMQEEPTMQEQKEVTQTITPKKEEVTQKPVVNKAPVETNKSVKEQPTKEQPKQAENKKPEVKKEQKATSNEVKTVAPKTNGNFVVQIVAVQSKEAAEKEMAKYRAKFPDVFMKQVQINGKTWYRVRLGVSTTKEEATQIAKRVTQEFNIKPIVTKNN